MERCGQCRGDGVAWDDRNGNWGNCPNCGGSGDVPYEQDEWYEDDDLEAMLEYMYLWDCLEADAAQLEDE